MHLMNSLTVMLFTVLISINSHAGNWKVHASDLRAKIAEIEQAEAKIEDLISQKKSRKSGNSSTEIIDQIVDAHKELKKAVEKYNKLRNHVRFEHPEQGDDTERKYRPHRFKSIEEFEDSVGIYGKLDRMKRKMKRTYGIEEKKPPAPPKVEKKKEDLDTEVPRVKLSY